jgi:hypothetical protein
MTGGRSLICIFANPSGRILRFVSRQTFHPALAAALVMQLVILASGCVSRPRNPAFPGGREFLLGMAGELEKHGIEVKNIKEGAATGKSFLEYVAANATLTVGLTDTDARKDFSIREKEFKELVRTISGLTRHGLEVREFLYYPSAPHTVEFCDGKLIMRSPEPIAPTSEPVSVPESKPKPKVPAK